MRLLMTTDTIGGVWTFTCELCEQLLRRGHELYLVSFGREPSLSQRQWCTKQCRQHSGRLSLSATTVPLEWMQNNEAAFEQGQEAILEDAFHFQPDLIVSNQFCFGRLATKTPRIVVAHSDVLSWAAACRPLALESTPWLNRYIGMVQAGLHGAAAVVAPTAWMGKALQSNFALPQGFSVIPNGIRMEGSKGETPERKLQAITAGRFWDEAKGLDTLRDVTSTMPLLVAGENSLETAGAADVWPRHLEALGPLSPFDLHDHFRQSAIYLCASRYEPFGLAPLEAALCGCAVVARDLPSLREVWGDSATYFTDVTSLSNILHKLTHDPYLLAQSQARSRERAAWFTSKSTTDSYLQLFQTVLQQSHPMSHVA